MYIYKISGGPKIIEFFVRTAHSQNILHYLKMTLYISLTLLLISALSCKKNDEVEKVADFFKNKSDEKELLATIDFSLSDSLLLRSIEIQTKTDLCKNSRFTARINYQDRIIEFPAFANKNCNWNAIPHNLIPIMINRKNQVVVDYEMVKSDESLENQLIKATKERIIGTERKNLLYLMQWDTELKPDLVKKRVYESLKGIKNYSNEISLSKFKKDISDLTETEKDLLKEEFVGIIGVNGYFPPPPPPPRMENETIEE
ncbi:MAG TPA: hypothetical protein VFD80_07335 [Flavobacteriaceae bacterium]|nr:hypothetical protein [Flavobacteriaceae bacterium]